jgi:hypothetical protein
MINALGEGQKITVRISQLFPKILMTPMKTDEVSEVPQRLLEHIKSFKQYPAILKAVFEMEKDILSISNINKYQDLMPDTDFRAIKDRFESLFFSKDTLGKYAERLGLHHEHAIASGRGSNDNLKALLMKLQEDIEKVVARKGDPDNNLDGLYKFADGTINKIETYQAVNLLSMDKDALFFLTLPFKFKNDVRTGEFYASKKGTVRGEELRAVLFLDMDNLGKVMAEARLNGSRIQCSFRCENPEVRNFLSARTTLLKDGLDALGYDTDAIKCYHEKNIDASRMAILEEFPAYSEGVLNITA